DGVGQVVKIASAVPLAAAEKQPLSTERLREQLGRLGGTPFRLGELKSFLEGDVILPVSELNRLRREAAAELEKLRAAPQRWTTTEFRKPAFADASAGRPDAGVHAPELIAVIRLLEQLDAAWSAGARTIYCEFENPKHYRDAVARFRELQSAQPSALNAQLPSSIWVAPPRIFKPGEEWI